MALLETDTCIDKLNDVLVMLAADVQNPSLEDLEAAIERAAHMLAAKSEYVQSPLLAWQICSMATAEEMQSADAVTARLGGIGSDTTLGEHVVRVAYALVYCQAVAIMEEVAREDGYEID